MRAFVIGSKELSCIVLEALLKNGFDVLGVYSRDQEPGMKVWHEMGHRSLATLAEEHSIPVYHNMKINSVSSITLLQSQNLDVIFSCFWSEIFKERVLDVARLGVFNIHAALLPKYRGSRPIPWAIINGESHSGLTVHKMLTGIDNGPIVDRLEVPITPKDNAVDVYNRIMDSAPSFIHRLVGTFLNESYALKPQADEEATYYPRGEPFGRQLNAHWNSAQQDRFKRAYHFPPFAEAIPSPKPFSIKGPSVIIAPMPADVDYIDLDVDFNLTEASIGSSDQRKVLKARIDQRPNYSFTQSVHRMYMLHDVIKGFGGQAVFSKEYSADEWSDVFPSSQPHRYENGLLEIPRVVIESDQDLKTVLSTAQLLTDQVKTDIFVVCRYCGFDPGRDGEPLNILHCSVEDIAGHFNKNLK